MGYYAGFTYVLEVSAIQGEVRDHQRCQLLAFVRNAESQAPPRDYWISTCFWTRSSAMPHAHSSLRSPALGHHPLTEGLATSAVPITGIHCTRVTHFSANDYPCPWVRMGLIKDLYNYSKVIKISNSRSSLLHQTHLNFFFFLISIKIKL